MHTSIVAKTRRKSQSFDCKPKRQPNAYILRIPNICSAIFFTQKDINEVHGFHRCCGPPRQMTGEPRNKNYPIIFVAGKGISVAIAPSEPTVLNNLLHGGDTVFPLRPTPRSIPATKKMPEVGILFCCGEGNRTPLKSLWGSPDHQALPPAVFSLFGHDNA